MIKRIHKTALVLQDSDQSRESFERELNEKLESISRKYPNSTPIQIPYSYSNRGTMDAIAGVLIQWHYEEPIKKSDIMIEGFVRAKISDYLKPSNSIEEREILVKQV